MLLKDPELVGYKPWLKFIWRGHISNWIWRERTSRRLTRLHHYIEMKMSYLQKYIEFASNLKAENTIGNNYDYNDEKIYSLWFQKKENAPHIVKQCLNSIEKIYGNRFVILDDKTMHDYISLPGYIWEKWDKKEICPANFSDIVRIELLYEHGGYWMDATDYIFRQIPEFISEADFFMFITSDKSFIHMFVQTCFLRAKKGDPLLKMWRDLIFEYWIHERKAIDYFIAHFLLRLLVTYNPEAKKLFDRMPKRYQDDLHLLWEVNGDKPYNPEIYKEMTEKVFFQKCSYRKQRHAVNNIIPGSMADFVINKL